MNPQQMRAMAQALPRGRHLHCASGSHMAMYDDQATYMAGLTAFLHEVDAGKV
jgi:proline iminopeptidase